MSRQGDAGLTLIEMMIVLVLIGVATSAAVIGLGRGSAAQKVEAESRRLVEMLSLAVDEAMVTRQPLRLEWHASGYFVTRADGKPPATARLAGGYDLPGGIALQRDTASDGALIIRPDGLGDPAALTIAGPRNSWTVRFDGLLAQATAAPA